MSFSSPPLPFPPTPALAEEKTILDLWSEIKPPPVVQSGVNKFYKTALETILRGLEVVVPLDGMTSATLYAEQYTAWHLLNAPGTKGKVTLSLFRLLGL